MIGNLLRYMYTKSYRYSSQFDKVIAEIKWCSFLTHMVEISHGLLVLKFLLVTMLRSMQCGF